MPVDKNIRILVVDDHENAAAILKNQLKKLGFANIDVVTGGDAAIQRMRTVRDYGLFLCDWTMHDVSGLDVLRQVRADEQLSRARFLMVTGNTRAEDVTAAREAGVNGYIVKPYNLETLQKRVEGVLA